MSLKKKKAFTLTELLVVVVIIGVLATVVLPKFAKVIETRKTAEAEEMMSAVRTEQEYRCSLDRPYIGNINQLSQSLSQKQTKYFNYTLLETGMLAKRTDKDYELRMLSYADGRICCEGAACAQLNKDYPTCEELRAKADFKNAAECAAEMPPDVEPVEPVDPVVPTLCEPGEKVVSSCKCQRETGKICSADGMAWEEYDNGTCALTDAEKTSCSCVEKPVYTMPCSEWFENDTVGGEMTYSPQCDSTTGSYKSVDKNDPAWWRWVSTDETGCYTIEGNTCAGWSTSLGSQCQYGVRTKPIINGKEQSADYRMEEKEFKQACCKKPTYQWELKQRGSTAVCTWGKVYGAWRWAFSGNEETWPCRCGDRGSVGHLKEEYVGEFPVWWANGNVPATLPANAFKDRECPDTDPRVCFDILEYGGREPTQGDGKAVHEYKCVAKPPYL